MLWMYIISISFMLIELYLIGEEINYINKLALMVGQLIPYFNIAFVIIWIMSGSKIIEVLKNKILYDTKVSIRF